MPSTRLDPHTVKSDQRATWDAISPGWEASLAVFERGAARVTDRLLELGGVRPGQRVLDVATGLGEPALTAARAVGPRGRVVGVDISPGMLEVAARRARGLGNIEFEVGDLEAIDRQTGSFDVVLSRWGLMFALDRVRALRTIAGLLAPGGVLAAAVWGPPRSAPMMSFGYAVLGKMIDLEPPPPGTPGPFTMSEPEGVAEELRAAGLGEVSVEEEVVPFRLRTGAEYAEFTRSVAPPALLRRVRDRFGSEDAPAVWRAVAEAVEDSYADGDGVLLPSTALCLRAVAPAG
ncbi:MULTISPECIES: class I SAM-dependent methyltransferase [unclassified Nocardiopsis]|uniref:class I SAM-dependent methyltransferase n=1 Tax=unclassified Nocardiopsis TaxID=2649073 RepID=UPI00135C9A1D|nr:MULTISPECIES: class I SAM-dependent methyltransferase [unclassified Nocardiopsis]